MEEDNKKEVKEYKCNIDGNCLCVIGDDFEDLVVSDAVFIELTEEQIEQIKKLK